MERFVFIFLRAALALSFLSAVADRFGFWGAPGATGVAWGNYANFTAYTARVNSFLPAKIAPFLAFVATTLEVILAVLLMVGFRLKEVALASGVLLLVFALAMAISFGPKPPLDYSVFSASAAAFALSLLASSRS